MVISLVNSLHNDAEIPYLVEGENLQNLFGIGVTGTGYSLNAAPVQIQVSREDEPTARKLLASIDK